MSEMFRLIQLLRYTWPPARGGSRTFDLLDTVGDTQTSSVGATCVALITLSQAGTFSDGNLRQYQFVGISYAFSST